MSDGGGEYAGQVGLTDLNTESNRHLFQARQQAARMRSNVPVKIIEVHATSKFPDQWTVDVQPLIHQMDGTGNPSKHGTVYGIPMFNGSGQNGSAIVQPKKGDMGLMAIGDRDASTGYQNKDFANPGSRRQHDFSDGHYMGGFNNINKADKHVVMKEDSMEMVHYEKIDRQQQQQQGQPQQGFGAGAQQGGDQQSQQDKPPNVFASVTLDRGSDKVTHVINYKSDSGSSGGGSGGAGGGSGGSSGGGSSSGGQEAKPFHTITMDRKGSLVTHQTHGQDGSESVTLKMDGSGNINVKNKNVCSVECPNVHMKTNVNVTGKLNATETITAGQAMGAPIINGQPGPVSGFSPGGSSPLELLKPGESLSDQLTAMNARIDKLSAIIEKLGYAGA